MARKVSMFDIVIPTLMGSNRDVFEYTLKNAAECDLVNSIIIIDNTIDCSFNISHDKLKVIRNKKNIFVNPAWNLGLSLVESQYYIICNDDILVHNSVYNITNKILQEPDVGLVTFKTENKRGLHEYTSILKEYNQDNIDYTTNIPEDRVGWFMAGRKNEWIDIPQELLIWFGDNFIYDTIKSRGLTPVMANYPIVHYTSTTIDTHSDRPIFLDIIYKDKQAWVSIDLDIQNGKYNKPV